MRRIILLSACFLLVAVYVHADMTQNGRSPREWPLATNQKQLENKDYAGDATTYTNLAVTGHNATGNAGFLSLNAVDSVGNLQTYFIWVDGSATSAGVLKMASFPNIKTFSSFPYGDWRSSTNFNAGVKVSSQ